MIATAASASQRADVFAFRYNVLACEQGVAADPSINHVNRTVVDPLTPPASSSPHGLMTCWRERSG